MVRVAPSRLFAFAPVGASSSGTAKKELGVNLQVNIQELYGISRA